MTPELVVVGTSWGGSAALRQLLAGLPRDFPAAIAIVKHHKSGSFARSLEATSPLPVQEVDDKDPLEHGVVYVAGPDYHLLVEPGHFALSTEEPVHYARPAIDVLFESAAHAYGEAVVAVVLTGTGEDGASGLACVKEFGGFTIAQDPSSAERGAMPRAAIATGSVDRVLPLEAIAPALVELCTAPDRVSSP